METTSFEALTAFFTSTKIYFRHHIFKQLHLRNISLPYLLYLS